MNKVNFLIIGANKSGTTSLFNYLSQHPQVFVPKIKEPMFFTYYYKDDIEDGIFYKDKVIKSIKSYNEIFAGSENFKARGEASTAYLANPHCAKNIFDYNPSMRIIAILRNPIERAFSNYLMYINWGEENRTFKKCLDDELKGVDLPQGKKYLYLGYYYDSLNIFIGTFGRPNIKIILNEDLKNNFEFTYKNICNFLEIDNSFLPDTSKRYNTNDSVEIRLFYKIIKKIDRAICFSSLSTELKNKIYSKPKMRRSERLFLKKIYKDEILRLQVLLNRDLNHWLID